jgi:hypothetical protein
VIRQKKMLWAAAVFTWDDLSETKTRFPNDHQDECFNRTIS